VRVDAHHHFWSPARGDYFWLTPELEVLYRDYLPEDLEPLLDEAGVGGTILVQAADTPDETRYLLELASRCPYVLGVVGWFDMEAPDAADTLRSLAREPKLVGVRPMIQDIADDDWMLRADLAPAFDAVIEQDLAFDALLHPRHLGNLDRLLERYPRLRVVIDHGAKPRIREGELAEWAAAMRRLSRKPDLHCKVSGLATEASPGWSAADLAPYLDHLLGCFGPERLMWGSDWPVLNLAGSYLEWCRVAQAHFAHLDEHERGAIFGGTARAFYRC
jgi:L-fuconolactonase